MYAPEAFDLPIPPGAHRTPTPPMLYLDERYQHGLGGETEQSVFRTGTRQVREAMALTAGMITLIDDQIGRVIRALKASGQFDNTVVIFNSDHGDYLGDFGMLLKGPMPFRGVTRVPMIWSDPESRKARRSDALASTIDLSATILDRAGLVPYNGIQGVSFLDCITRRSSHRSELLIEFNDAVARVGFSSAARVRTLLTRHYRITCYKGEDWGELYDLQRDPNECRNVWDDPDYARVKTKATGTAH